MEAIGRTPAIFSGQVRGVERGQPPYSPNILATIDVRDRWKGEVPDRLTFYGSSDSSACGYDHFPVGETITLLAYPVEASGRRPAGFTTDSCIMSVLHFQPAEVLRLLSEFRAERDRIEGAVVASHDSPATLLERARFLERWKDPAAIAAYADLAARVPNLLAAHLGSARVLIQARRLQDAKAAVARAQALAPLDPEASRLDIQARLLTGDASALDAVRDLHGLVIPELDRSRRDLRRSDWSDARIGKLRLAGADLREADLQRLSATAADLADARLDAASMTGIQLAEASLPRASLRNAVAPDASFANADLTGAALDGASLPGANFRHAKLIGATFGRARLVGADFTGADLDGADLSRADLRGATFKDAYYGCRTRLPRGMTPQGLGMWLAEPSAPPCR